MPTYVYRREDGTKFEIQQRITEDPLETCPETGQSVERLITGSAGLIFKGDGFYVNDYARSDARRNGSKNESAETSTSDSSADSSASAASSEDASASAASSGTSDE